MARPRRGVSVNFLLPHAVDLHAGGMRAGKAVKRAAFPAGVALSESEISDIAKAITEGITFRISYAVEDFILMV